MRALSMQPAAVRKRKEREKRRGPAIVTATSSVAPASPAVSSAPPPQPSTPSQPIATPIPSSPAPARPLSYSLLETTVVTGPGADAFSGPTAIGGDDDGNGATPIVEPAPAAPATPTSQAEAAAIGKAIAMYCGFGWGELLSRNEDQLAAMVPNEQMRQGMFNGGLALVEQSATNLALKYNVRIPWGDELTVGLGVGVATLGVAQKFKKPSNDNRKRASSSSAPAAPTAARDTSRDSDKDSPIDDDGEFSPIDMSPSARTGDEKEVELG